jgi:hypothetical protein
MVEMRRFRENGRMTGEPTAPSRALYAVSRGGTIVNERSGAISVPGHFAAAPGRTARKIRPSTEG